MSDKTGENGWAGDTLNSMVVFFERVECYCRLAFGGFAWRMAAMKQKQRRINEDAKQNETAHREA